MSDLGYPGLCWPSREQKELLVLALGDEQALTLWNASWKNADLSAIDRAGQRLLPLIWHNLSRLGVHSDNLGFAEISYRKTWYQNQLHLRDITKVVESMQRADIAPILVKGGALILATYDSAGLRPMSDLDILVRTSDADRATDILEPEWVPQVRKLRAGYKNTMHSLGFVCEHTKREIDLHWALLSETVGQDTDSVYWDRAEHVKLPSGLEVLALSPTDQLIQTCVHGLKNNWGNVAPIWWITDSAWLLKKHTIDWDTLIRIAQRQRLIVPLRHALRYLSDEMKLSIPVEHLDQLYAMPVTAQEEREFGAKSGRFGYYNHVRIIWYSYRRTVPHLTGLSVFNGFLSYLQHRWGVEGACETIRHILQKPFLRWQARVAVKKRSMRKC
jgi:hypothetical protein